MNGLDKLEINGVLHVLRWTPTGEWIEHDDESVLCECSACHEKYAIYEEHVLGRRFCPNCGAMMKSEAKEREATTNE